METTEVVLYGVVMALGLLGIVVPFIPGTLLILGAILVWALRIGDGSAWVTFGICAVIALGATVVKYLIAGKQIKAKDISNTTIFIGGICGIIGFFVIPVLGLFVGFIVGAAGAEYLKKQDMEAAWRGGVAALKAVGTTMLIELGGGLLACGVWVAALVIS